jgi:cell division septation protein DedD
MSREAELYKDKIEVSLDGRQIFYLFFGGAVIVGLVFVLGVMVGRRVEARGHTDRARVAATVDPLAALDRLEGGNGLSFQGALRGADGPVSDVEKTIAAMPKKDDKPEETRVEKKADVAKVEPAKDEKKVEPAKDEKKVEPAKVESAKDEKKADTAKIEPAKDEKKAEPAKDDKKAEVAKTEPGKEAKKAEPAKDDKKPEPKFVLQLSSFQDKAEAQAYLETMKGAGYQPYMTEASVDGKHYFRIRMGQYKTIESAYDAKAELEKTGKRSAIIIKL